MRLTKTGNNGREGRRERKRRGSRAISGAALGLAAVLAWTVPMAPMASMVSFAAEKPEDMDEAVWARLQDNVLEYGEIEDLVVLYNPTYLQVMGNIQANVDPITDAAEDFRQAARDFTSDALDYKEEGDLMNQMISEAMAKTSRSMAKQMDSVERSILGGTSTVRNQLRKQMTSAIQQMDIMYGQLLASKEAADVGVELAEAAYQSSVTQQSIGMATATDVQNAQKAFLSAQGQQKMLDDNITALRQNLCMMTGWTYNASPEIAPVPEPDVSRIDQMNPEVDLTRAINNNYTLRQQRGLSHGSSVDRDIRNRTLEETESQIKIGLDSLYQAVLQSRQTYEAAQTAYASAQITMQGNETRYQLGMMGRLEYLQAKVAYLGQKAAARTAGLNLTQAMENYDWALEGLLDLSGQTAG